MKELAQREKGERGSVVRGRPYTDFGKVMDEMARKRDIRGPFRIANFMRSRLGNGPSGVAVTKWLHGDATPKTEHMKAFATAFQLSSEEMEELAMVYTFWHPTAA